MRKTEKIKKTHLVIFILLSLIISSQIINDVHAQKVATLEEKGSAFIVDVLGIDLEKYAVAIRAGPATQPNLFNVSRLFIEQTVGYNLTSETSVVSVSIFFRNGQLSYCQIHSIKGSPIYIQQTPTSDFDYSKSILQKYQSFVSQYWNIDVSYIRSANNLISATVTNSSAPLIEGKMKFEVTTAPERSFKWTYTENNISVLPKRIELVFRNGSLYSLYDCWNLYTVGNLEHISEDRAVSLALPAAKNFSLNFMQRTPIYGANDTIIGQNETRLSIKPDLTNTTTQVFFNIQTRNSSTVLCSIWVVNFYFYKPIYDVKGVTVTVWGDTGEIDSIYTIGEFGDHIAPTDTQNNPPATWSNLLALLSTGMVVTVVLVIAVNGVILKKRRR